MPQQAPHAGLPGATARYRQASIQRPEGIEKGWETPVQGKDMVEPAIMHSAKYVSLCKANAAICIEAGILLAGGAAP